jgi:membrane associated rhomboid family serine protease
VAFSLILKAGMVNALLLTVLSALMIALINGAGTSAPEYRPGVNPDPSIRNYVPNPIELAKTSLLLCPITAVSYGWFGALAGLVSATFLHLRRRRIRSNKRLILEAAIFGVILGCLYPFFVAWSGQWESPLFLLAFIFVGGICAAMCAAVLRNRFLAPTATRPS